MNKAILIGNVGQDPELTYTQSGTPICKFSMATNERSGDEDITDWHNIIIWGKRAEVANKYVSKGDKLCVEGKIKTNKWEDKEGITRYMTQINVYNFEFISNRRREEDSQPPPPQEPVNDDDIPF